MHCNGDGAKRAFRLGLELVLWFARTEGAAHLALTSFEKGKLKIMAHVREELDRAGITGQSIRCKSGGTHTPPDTASFVVTVNGTPAHVDFKVYEVEECESIVAGEAWYKIAELINRLRRQVT